MTATSLPEVARLLEIVARLRGPGGCPWDRKQTHATLRGSVIEEAYEVVEAIDEADDAHLREELGDLLLQVALHAAIAQEEERFDFEAIAAELSEKLIRRHPHVFGDATAGDAEEVITQWDAIKRAEKGALAPESALDGVSSALPALLHAEKITKRAAKVGFDWERPEQVLGKIREEVAEVEEVVAQGESQERLEEEIGDLLFAVVNLARKSKIEPEVALRRATGKFTRRFQRVEAQLKERGLRPEESTLEEMDAIWDAIKHAPASS